MNLLDLVNGMNSVEWKKQFDSAEKLKNKIVWTIDFPYLYEIKEEYTTNFNRHNMFCSSIKEAIDQQIYMDLQTSIYKIKIIDVTVFNIVFVVLNKFDTVESAVRAEKLELL